MNERSPLIARLRARELLLLALVMAGVFVPLAPEVSPLLPLAATSAVWLVQVGFGLATLRFVIRSLARRRTLARVPDLPLTVAAGFITSIVVAGPYYLGDFLLGRLGFPTADPLPVGLADWVAGIADEWRHVVLPVIGVALLLAMAGRWAAGREPDLELAAPPGGDGSAPTATIGAPPRAVAGPGLAPGEPARQAPPADTRAAWRERLPAALGTDLVGVKSELQYLRVWTTRGSALVLGSLRDVRASEGDAGLSPHRSWWVMVRHVQAVRRRREGYVCVLDNGLVVPVSRRRQAEIVARFGNTATLVAEVSERGPLR